MNKRSSHGACTLPGNYYTSPAVFKTEFEKIFYEHWLYVGHVSRLKKAGDYLLEQIGNESVIVVRGADQEVRAFYNVCRHRGTRLCEETSGSFDGRIQCPYHAWTYGLDGRLLGAPNMNDVENFRLEKYPLHPVALHLWQGMIFVNLSVNPRSFEKVLPMLDHRFDSWQISELQSVHTAVYNVNANWKMIFQNYSECYHCPKVHPVLVRLSPYSNSDNQFDEGKILGGPMQMKADSMTMTGQSCAAPFTGLNERDRHHVFYYSIFPSMFLTLHPDYVLMHRLEPQSPDHTRITCDWYFHPDAAAAADFQPAPAIEFWDLTNRQDWHVCELSQQGVSSRSYTPGPYADLESLLAAFDREYLRVINEGSVLKAG